MTTLEQLRRQLLGRTIHRVEGNLSYGRGEYGSVLLYLDDDTILTLPIACSDPAPPDHVEYRKAKP